MIDIKLLALDVGTTQSGFCLLNSEDFKPLHFGKINNEDLLLIVKDAPYDQMVYEEFQSYGMAIGSSTIISVTWNGRYIQSCLDRNIPVDKIYRKDEKVNLCGTTKAKDSNIRMALIDRFARHDLSNGKGTKKNPDWFYGFSKDMWTAYAIGVTWLDKQNEGEINV